MISYFRFYFLRLRPIRSKSPVGIPDAMVRKFESRTRPLFSCFASGKWFIDSIVELIFSKVALCIQPNLRFAKLQRFDHLSPLPSKVETIDMIRRGPRKLLSFFRHSIMNQIKCPYIELLLLYEKLKFQWCSPHCHWKCSITVEWWNPFVVQKSWSRCRPPFEIRRCW